ncbi:hypothetical protein FOA52_003820 [Chlamydomonas sp. UWO 241]|nr:hypothetical protein FOA52_003820 [Chlamydomonas sp. UWO 241]
MRATGQGSNRVLLVGILGFIGVSIYALVVTHNLHLDEYFARATAEHDAPGLSAQELFGQAFVDTSDPEAFATRLTASGAFGKYDHDGDGRITQGEFQAFLQDLARSRMLGSGADSAARKKLKERLLEEIKASLAGREGETQPDKAPEKRAEEERPAEQEKKTEPGPEKKAEPVAAEERPAETDKKAEPAEEKVEPVEEKKAEPVEEKKAEPVVDKVPEPEKKTEETPPKKAGGEVAHCPELSKELLSQFAVNNTIMLTVCDWNIFGSMGINWVQHLKKLGVTYWIVGATDSKTSEYLASGDGKHPCFKFWEGDQDANTNGEYKYGSDHYRQATWRKVTVVEKIVDWGFNVLHSDVDAVWFRDPLPYMLGPHLENIDVAVSTDLISTNNPEGDEGLELGGHKHVNLNTGVYFVKPTPGGKHFMANWAELRKTKTGDNDQTGLYGYVRGTPDQREGPRMIAMRDGKVPVNLGLLSVGMLLNGYSYFIPQLHIAKKVNPLGAHMTWLPLSREGKFHRMRDGMLYNDPKEYYDGPKFITADIDFSESPPDYNAWMDTEKMIQYHLLNIDKQLVQAYRVMAIATMLNRTLILPKMQCFCYKNWFMMEQCRIPGDKVTQFPIECHLDQWIRPKVIYNYGAQIVGQRGAQPFLFREHSLLSNPNFPAATLQRQVTIVPGEKTCADGPCEASDPVPAAAAGGGWSVTVPRSLRQNNLLKVFEKLKDEPLIRLTKPMRLFGGFDDEKLKASFVLFVDKIAGNWCCRDRPFIDKGAKEKEKTAIVEALTKRVFFPDDKGLTVPDPDW